MSEAADRLRTRAITVHTQLPKDEGDAALAVTDVAEQVHAQLIIVGNNPLGDPALGCGRQCRAVWRVLYVADRLHRGSCGAASADDLPFVSKHSPSCCLVRMSRTASTGEAVSVGSAPAVVPRVARH